MPRWQTWKNFAQNLHIATIVMLICAFASATAQAQIDGHGPDSWRVTGVRAPDTLNARMGPGTDYPVIEKFAADARGLEQITCVPFYALRHYNKMSQAQIADLPPRWCLVRDAEMVRAGWVAQRFITPDDVEISVIKTAHQTGDSLIEGAQSLVQDLYGAFERADTRASNPFMQPEADKYFFADLIPDLVGHGADVLYNGQDFQGEITHIGPDPEQPMFRGTIAINVDFTNFGRSQRAVFWLRADTARPKAPFRILYVEHEDWSFP